VQSSGRVDRDGGKLGVIGVIRHAHVGGVAGREVPVAAGRPGLREDLRMVPVEAIVPPHDVERAIAGGGRNRDVAVVAERLRMIRGGETDVRRPTRVPRAPGRLRLREDLHVVDAAHAVVMPEEMKVAVRRGGEGRELGADVVARIARIRSRVVDHELRRSPSACAEPLRPDSILLTG
jgi:hypothetical protein